MKAEYDLTKLKGRRNPYAKALKKQVPVRAKTHEEVLKPLLKDSKFRKGYQKELLMLRRRLTVPGTAGTG